ncbi:MAG: hypothetical protein FJW35_07680 [Acidobacteria bacterium]|nr:hypothetical protein [Acidobacteriota bacterium]
MDEESTIYRGSPSRLLNLPVFAAALLAIVVAAALGLQAWPVLALGVFPAAVAGWELMAYEH